jgi:hypothetical protein
LVHSPSGLPFGAIISHILCLVMIGSFKRHLERHDVGNDNRAR